MIKNSNQLLYPNPFRYRKFTDIISRYEAIEEVQEALRICLLTPHIEDVSTYMNEFGDLKSELKIVRFFRFLILQRIDALWIKIDLMFQKRKLLRLAKFLTTPIRKPLKKRAIIEFGNQLDNITYNYSYERNLRLVDLPVQAFTDKYGYEIRDLSEEFMESAIQDMIEGYTSIYDYSTHQFPDAIELWDDLARYLPGIYPEVVADKLIGTRDLIIDILSYELHQNYYGFKKWLFTSTSRRIVRIVPISLHPNIKELLYTIGRHITFVMFFGGVTWAILTKYDSVRYIDLTEEDFKKRTLNFQIAELKEFSLSETLLDIEAELLGLTTWLHYSLQRLSLGIKTVNLPLKIKYKTLKLLIGRN